MDNSAKLLITIGKTFSETANAMSRKFGNIFSRCAIAGRMKRLGVKALTRKKAIESVRTATPKVAIQQHRSKLPKPPPRPVRPVVAGGHGVALLDLEPDGCRFPIIERNDGRHLFCGNPQKDKQDEQNKSCYCAEHHEICWVPVRRPQRATAR